MQVEDLQNEKKKKKIGESNLKKKQKNVDWIAVAELLRIIIMCKLFISGEYLAHGVGEREWLKKDTRQMKNFKF